MPKTKEQYIQEIKDKRIFDYRQIQEIDRGLFHDNLDIEQVTVYAKTDLDSRQMEEIRTGFKDGLSMEQVEFYASPFSIDRHYGLERYISAFLNCEQMAEVRKGFENGLNIEQIKLYANENNFNFENMSQIRMYLEDGFSYEQVSLISELFLTTTFSEFQKNEILCGLENGLTLEQVEVYLNPEFKGDQMREIRKGLEDEFGIQEGDEIAQSIELVKIYANPKYKSSEMEKSRLRICSGLKENFTQEQVKLFANPHLDLNQAIEIQQGFLNKLTQEKVELYARPSFDASQMQIMREAFENGASIEQVKTFANPSFSAYQMNVINQCFIDGIDKSSEEFKIYTSGGFNKKQMIQIQQGLEDGLSPKQVKSYSNPAFSWGRMSYERKSLTNMLRNKEKNKTENEKFTELKNVASKFNNDESSNGQGTENSKNIEQNNSDTQGGEDEPEL